MIKEPIIQYEKHLSDFTVPVNCPISGALCYKNECMVGWYCAIRKYVEDEVEKVKEEKKSK